MLWTTVALVVLALAGAQAKVYGRCELFKELRDVHRMPREQLATWVCIAHRESNYNTDAISKPNKNGSRDHGIFQINDKYWCSPGTGCGVSCATIRGSLAESVKCAKKIQGTQGFKAWTTYKFCQNPASYIQGC